MYETWGSVPGDTNASAIITDRKSGKQTAMWVGAGVGIAFLIVAYWYGSSGEPGALAWLILLAVWSINGNTSSDLYPTHTFIMIAERRTQLLEQAVQEMMGEVSAMRRELERTRETRRHDY